MTGVIVLVGTKTLISRSFCAAERWHGMGGRCRLLGSFLRGREFLSADPDVQERERTSGVLRWARPWCSSKVHLGNKLLEIRKHWYFCNFKFAGQFKNFIYHLFLL